ESPSKSSLGRSYIRNAGGSGFMLSSYVDIYTEVSTDNGASWTPACCPIRWSLDPVPPYLQAVLALNPTAYFRLDETTQPPPQLMANNLGNLGPAGNGNYFGGSPGVRGALAGSADTATRFGGAVGVPFTQPLSLHPPFTVEAWLKAGAPLA